MKFFNDLGLLVDQLWRDRDYDEDRFPRVAADALTRMSPVSAVDPWDIVRWISQTKHLPEQHDQDGAFSDLPITVYDGPGFYIDVYFWLDGTTSIHQHAFCGAFQVMQGSSILTLYEFEQSQRVETHLAIGSTRVKQVELLEQGTVRQILPGSGYIHSLFHLERPSVSVVVRTRRTESGWPQYKYLKPNFAVNPFFKSALTSKKIQSVSLLLRMRHPEADKLIGSMLEESEFYTTFVILDLVYDHFTNDWLAEAFGVAKGEGRFDALLDIARRKHGSSVDLIVPVIEEVRRQRYLIQRRGQITSSEHRYFLALLLNVPDKKNLITMVKRRFPEQDPIETIVNWVEELANTRVMGSTEPNVLAADDFDERYLCVLEWMLEGGTLDQIRRKFKREFPVDAEQEVGDKPQELYDSIRNSMFFKSIFADKPLIKTASRLRLVAGRAADPVKKRRKQTQASR